MIDGEQKDPIATASRLDHAGPAVADAEPSDPLADELVEADVLVEDVSIDGMCGVY